MRRKVIVHAGTEKTGTTTLQKFLAANRAHLARSGFYYPSSLGEENHVRLCGLAQSDTPRFPTVDNIIGITDAASRARFKAECSVEFAEELARMPAQIHTVILSCELLHSNLINVSDLLRLKSVLDTFFSSVRITLYLRRQVELAVSLFSTRIKGGELWSQDVFPPVQPGFLPYYFDYAAILAHYEAAFGRTSIDLRIFQPDRLVDGDVVRDFMRLHAIPDQAAVVGVGRQNVSLSFDELYVLAVLNEHVPVTLHGHWNANRDMLVECFENAASSRNEPIASRSEAEDFASFFDKSNERVRQGYFPEWPRLFSDDYSRYPASVDRKLPSAADAARIFGQVWNERAAFARRNHPIADPVLP